jgi:hypothetical protein
LSNHKGDKPCREKEKQLVISLGKCWKRTLERQAAFANQGINQTEQSGRGAGFVPSYGVYSVIPVFEAHDFFIEVADVVRNDQLWDRKQERVQPISGECQKVLCEKWKFRQLKKAASEGIAKKYRKVLDWHRKKG